MMTAHTVVVDIGAALGPLTSYFLIDLARLTLVYSLAGVLLILLGAIWIGFGEKTMMHRKENT
ncbi:hypothetical protein J9303_06825 [Bacillaceae bacterium Marseille-Q3522]|nr:hypothetical protein [Bacillaceae bacterium Marseille-Q3522]